MSRLLPFVRAAFVGEPQANRVVPPTGMTAQLTLFAAAAMAFLAVFALALSLAAGRQADRWGNELARAATLRIVAPVEQRAAQTEAALRVLQTTKGVETVRALSDAEQSALLAPWFGAELALDQLPVPRLIEIVQDGDGFDAEGLRLRLAAEVPGATLEDHSQWRAPLAQAAGRLRVLGWFVVFLIATTVAAMISLAAHAALAANAQVIAVLRLVGATDDYIARAFVHRFTMRTFVGACVGALLGMLAIVLMPDPAPMTDVLTDFGFQGASWLLPLVIPIMAAGVAFTATKLAARHTLKELA